MAEQTRMDSHPQLDPSAWHAPSECQSHSEHVAALDATVFRSEGSGPELVLELEAGVLRLRPADRSRPRSR